MNSRFKLSLFTSLIAIVSICFASNGLAQTINIHFGNKKKDKREAVRKGVQQDIENTRHVGPESILPIPSVPSAPLAMPEYRGVESFAQFAPRNTDMVLVLKPQQLAELPPLKAQLAVKASLAKALSKEELNPADIETIVVAANRRNIVATLSRQSQQVFAKIAAELDGETGTPAPEEIESAFNKDFCGLIRFTQPTSWETIKRELKQCYGSETFEVEKWRGLDLLSTGNDNCWVVIRQDDRTFLVGNRNDLAKSLEDRTHNQDSKANQWISDLTSSQFDGEAFLATKIYPDDVPTEFFPPDSIWTSVAAVKELRTAIAINQPRLMTVDCRFDNQQEAALFQERMLESLKELKEMYVAMSDQLPANRSEDARLKEIREQLNRQMHQTNELLTSIEISGKDSSVRIAVPRPENFEEQVTRYLSGMALLQSGTGTSDFEPVGSTTVDMKPVLIFTKSVKAGEVITEDDIRQETWPAQIIPDNATTDAANVVGKRASGRTHKGQPVMKSHILPAN